MNQIPKNITSMSDIENMPKYKLVRFKCIKCGKYQTNNIRRLIEKGKLLCGDCQKAKTNLEKFGYECLLDRPGMHEAALKAIADNKEEVQRKREESCLKTTGSRNPMQSEIGRRHYVETDMRNHGGIIHQRTPEERKQQSERMLSHPEIQLKSVETNKKNHGGIHSLALPENREKCMKVVTDPVKKKEIQKTREESTLKSKGKKQWMTFGSKEYIDNMIYKIRNEYIDVDIPESDDITFNDLCKALYSSKIFKNKVLNSIINRFELDDMLKNNENGDISFSSVSKLLHVLYPEWDYNSKRAVLEKYGTLCVTYKYNYYGVFFDSSWELAVWIYCIDNNIPIVRNPTILEYKDVDGINKYYEPDFMINGQLVEIKGDHYFKEDGSMYYPYSRRHRYGPDFTKEEKEYYNGLYEAKHKCGISNGIVFWKSSECKKYLDYCNNKYPNWDNIYRKDNPYNPSYWCYYINNTYIPNYYNNSNYNKGKGISPYDINNKDSYTIYGKGISIYDIKR